MNKCPYCTKSIHFEETDGSVYEFDENSKPKSSEINGFSISHGFCPSCDQLIVLYREVVFEGSQYEDNLSTVLIEEVVYPKHFTRNLPSEVPEPYKTDFTEANSVLPLSPRASAAISRRSLQNILREHFKIKKGSLASEIEIFLNLPGIPSYLSEAVDAIRNVGNFAAHPLKNTRTGEIVPVEDGEAEWLLDVLDALFDFAFVQPTLLEKRKKQLNDKLKNMGKPPMKGASKS